MMLMPTSWAGGLHFGGDYVPGVGWREAAHVGHDRRSQKTGEVFVVWRSGRFGLHAGAPIRKS
jgi:hypothetical protein